jgi:hypothetical protein
MTALIETHRRRETWPDWDDNEYVIARVCDADAQRGVAYWAPGQLWSRAAEGRKQVWS